ncbi:hypothetical protein DERP_002776 [Dermatophagoides pteronyssinus]|uniref:Uncharacterized protein n=1 Tax=Dermatophagoides pteronyssinus TaxID=6956 RepID=A0ABQ8JVS4_DERPT|nr:hypothetical protein DERP_002776 [Dermatophagoides pteronyssinus]
MIIHFSVKSSQYIPLHSHRIDIFLLSTTMFNHNITITVYMMTRKQEIVDDFGATTNNTTDVPPISTQ